MGFTTKPEMVRVDFFKESGKWYTTEEIHWDTYSSGTETIHDIFRRCLTQKFPRNYVGMTAVCLEPYHSHSHPLMVVHKGKE